MGGLEGMVMLEMVWYDNEDFGGSGGIVLVVWRW